MSVFVDTSAFYALLVETERAHDSVFAVFRRLLEGARELRTTSYVIVETVALLQARIGLRPVRDLQDKLLPLVSVEWVGVPLHERGMVRLLKESRRRLSLVDCVSLEKMEADGITEAFALDPHFAVAGHHLLPPARA